MRAGRVCEERSLAEAHAPFCPPELARDLVRSKPISRRHVRSLTLRDDKKKGLLISIQWRFVDQC